MASISNDGGGRRRILFVNGNGDRKAIRLGKMPMKAAESILVRVEALNAASISNTPIDGETAAWLRGIEDSLHAKLAAVGLTTPRNSMTLGEFLDDFIRKRDTSKANSLRNFLQAKGRLTDFYGSTVDVRTITSSMAENFVADMQKAGYAKATIGRTIKYAKQFFKAALRDKIITENPFECIKAMAQTNETRKHFVSREVTGQVIDACPDTEWRLIIALCRFAGVRCPSEVLTLRWQDVNFGKNRILIHAPKTEHHADNGDRLVPIFPELKPYLEEAFDLAKPGTEFVINRYRDATNANLRTQLMRIIKRAGVKAWPKLFHNLRASRETELAAEYPLHVVCEWIGNSARIASAHYLQVTEADFDRAAQSGAESGAVVAQNRAQQAAVMVGNGSQEWTEAQEIRRDMQMDADGCEPTQNYLVRPEGVEPPTYGSEDQRPGFYDLLEKPVWKRTSGRKPALDGRRNFLHFTLFFNGLQRILYHSVPLN
ncbi:MAG TPA: tyrosine-type recombinase/integrase [Gemmataceae bacterium]|nr:tyrosine-type recombinase/integrase [Gemmataceae bacterium]